MRKRISQRQAHAMRKRLAEMEHADEMRRNAWGREWPDGVHIATIENEPVNYKLVRLARKLGHGVVAVSLNDNQIALYAVRV